jgi:hypothetical protein
MREWRFLSEEECRNLTEEEKEEYSTWLMSVRVRTRSERKGYTVLSDYQLQRRKKREVSLELCDPQPSRMSYRELAMREIAQAERKARLKPREEKAFMLYQEQATYAGVARAMHIDRRTAKRLVDNATDSIRKLAGRWWGWWEVYLSETIGKRKRHRKLKRLKSVKRPRITKRKKV